MAFSSVCTAISIKILNVSSIIFKHHYFYDGQIPKGCWIAECDDVWQIVRDGRVVAFNV